jgi:hypothetical protein
MIRYSPIRASPSSQFDSPSKTITAARMAEIATVPARSGDTASVRGVTPISIEMMTRAGVRAIATWSDELRMRLTASSAWLRAAAWMPTTFSTALPAIATTTSPANASDIPSIAIAGRSAPTNQSETKAAATAATASTPRASHWGQRWPGPSDATTAAAVAGTTGGVSRRMEKTSDPAKTMRRTIETTTESSAAWPASGAPTSVASVGMTSAPTARRRSVAIERLARAPNVCVPNLRPPTRKAAPRTRRLLARMDPMSANWTTTTSPAWRLKNPMKSSGRLPSAD